jgi:hypothetical protein
MCRRAFANAQLDFIIIQKLKRRLPIAATRYAMSLLKARAQDLTMIE